MRVLFLLAFALSALAQDLKELTAEALRNSPEILAAQKRYEAARQRPRQESSLPDPTLSLGYSSTGNPLPGAGLGSEVTSNIGFSVTQDFPYPGKLRLRGQISSKEADAEMEQYRAVERDVLFRLAQAFHRLHHSYAATEVLDRNHALLETLLRTIEARYSVGKGSQEEAFKTQTQLTILETQRVQVDRDRRARTAEINSILNRPAGTPILQPSESHVHAIAMPLEELQVRARFGAGATTRSEVAGTVRAGAEPGAQGFVSRLRVHRWLLQHGRNAGDVPISRRHQSAVAVRAAAGGSERAVAEHGGGAA